MTTPNKIVMNLSDYRNIEHSYEATFLSLDLQSAKFKITKCGDGTKINKKITVPKRTIKPLSCFDFCEDLCSEYLYSFLQIMSFSSNDILSCDLKITDEPLQIENCVFIRKPFLTNGKFVYLIFTIDYSKITDYNNSIFKQFLHIIYMKNKGIIKSKYINDIYANGDKYLSIISPKANKIKIKSKFELYGHQNNSLKKMIEIENSPIRKIPGKSKIYNINDKHFGFKMMSGSTSLAKAELIEVKNKTVYDLITSKGGVLADVVGLGKTFTLLSLIDCNTKPSDMKFMRSVHESIKTNCSLIIVPNHLAKQTVIETNKFYPDMKISSLLTMTNHNKLTYEDVINSDILIVTFGFLKNKNGYRQFIDEVVYEPEHINNMKTKNPLLHNIFFRRVIIDEAHEIFPFGRKCGVKHDIFHYIHNLNYLNSWYVSGTPFNNCYDLEKIFEFLEIKKNGKKYDYFVKIKPNNRTDESYADHAIENYFIRHIKKDVIDEIKIEEYEEKVYKISLTEFEKNFYNNALRNAEENTYLQQLCCHPLISEKYSQYFKNYGNLGDMKNALVNETIEKIASYENKLLTETNERSKGQFRSMIKQLNFFMNIILGNHDKLDTSQDCIVCLDLLKNPLVTKCGHIYCKQCIEECMKQKTECPMCKTKLSKKDMILINKQNTETNSEENPFIKKYGSKLGKLISLSRQILSNPENKIIIFSQWDNMLKLVAHSLAENGIKNSFVKGNVYVRNNIINNFKIKNSQDRVIMLSLLNNASGINLTEATHIIFVEPINAPKSNIQTIERQAIGRAHRIGQTKKLQIIRIITLDTIEEQIFKQKYKHLIDKIIE